MTERQVLRYEVPVDDQPHEFTLRVDPESTDRCVIQVGCRKIDAMEFWVLDDPRFSMRARFQVSDRPPGSRGRGLDRNGIDP